MSIVDQRAASGIVASLSSYVATATLAVLGAQAVIVTFILDKRDHLGFFYALSVIGFVILVASIFVGGKGVNEIAEAGALGIWKTKTEGKKFAWQSVLALIGVAIVAASATTGRDKPDRTNAQYLQISRQIADVTGSLRQAQSQVTSLQAKVVSLQTRIGRLEQQKPDR